MVCTATGVAQLGQYANVASVVGTPDGPDVSDTDPSHYFGVRPSIDIEKATNGEDADTPTGPYIPVDDSVNWTYEVTNDGNVLLVDVTVTDDRGVKVNCPKYELDVSETMTCVGNPGIAQAGQYANMGFVNGTPPSGPDVNDDDPSHYYGSLPNIDIEKATNGEDADTPAGPIIDIGEEVIWTYVVVNTGNVALRNVAVTDDQGADRLLPQDTLAVDETMTCTASGIAVEGQYANIGSVSGFSPTEEEVTDSDPSHYYGSLPNIDIEKATNGEDADTPTGLIIDIGDEVIWTYMVVNTGNVALRNVAVTDDQGVTVSCPQDTLAVDETMTCTASGIAVEGQYANIGSVSGFSPTEEEVTDSDPSRLMSDASRRRSTAAISLNAPPSFFLPMLGR